MLLHYESEGVEESFKMIVAERESCNV